MKASRLIARIVTALALAVTLVPATPAVALAAPGVASAAGIPVIVRSAGGALAAGAAVESAGGVVTRDLSIIGGVAANVPGSSLTLLGMTPGIIVTPDAAIERSARSVTPPPTVSGPKNTYLDTTGVRQVWNLRDKSGLRLTGRGIGIAIVDSGISSDADFNSISRDSFNPNASSVNDTFGHGTHVAGIAAGNGSANPALAGVAPGVDIISCRIADEEGNASESDAVAALQFIFENRVKYNIRVVNLSVNCGVPQSYTESPLDAAAEILWFNGIVVVASAGNNANTGVQTINAAPANDPFIITVGAADEKATTAISDDVVASFSAYGVTRDGVAKPDIIAPGTNIWSVLSKSSEWASIAPDRVSPDGEYFRISGTSMAAPMVAGTAALLLQDEPNLTPDQVKYRLIMSGRNVAGADGNYPYLSAYAAVTGNSSQSDNTGIPVSTLLTTGENPVNSSVMWNSVMWNSVMWNSVMWNSVMWNSVMWNSVMWNSVMWAR